MSWGAPTVRPKTHQRSHFRTAELAVAFGVAEETVRRYAKDGKIPFIKLGTIYLYPRAAIRKMIRTGHHLKV